MKWISSLIIVLSITWFGYEFSKKLANRPQIIRLLKNALQILEAEIVYSQTSIKESCYTVARQTPEPVSYLFKSVGNALEKDQESLYPIWEKKLYEFYQEHAIQYEDVEIMNQFGRTLGQHDILQQQKHIRLTITHLDRQLDVAEKTYRKYGKMPSSIGFLTGLFIVLLLL